MSSGNFPEELRLGSGKLSSSSKKGKRSKQGKARPPQRGLGVAELEKIRIQSETNEVHASNSMNSLIQINLNMDLALEVPASSSSSTSAPSSSYTNISPQSFALLPNVMMVNGETETISGYININDRYDQPNNPMYRNNINISPFHNAATSSSAILPLFAQPTEDSSQKKRRHDLSHSNVISPNTNEDPQDNLDLDLKLSIL